MPAFDPVFPVPLIIAMALMPAVWFVYRAIRGRKPTPRWLIVPIALLRFGTLALIALLLLNPVEPVSRTAPDFSTLFVVDRSGSMGLGPDGGKSRLGEAAEWVSETTKALRTSGSGGVTVRTFGTVLGDPVAPEDLGAISADGDATRLAASLVELADSGKPPSHIQVISDGCIHDRSGLSAAIGHLRAVGTTVSTHTVGSDTPPRNAWIARVDAPRIVRAGARVAVTATVNTTGLAADSPLVLTLKDAEGRTIQQKSLAAAAEATCTFEFPAAIRTESYQLELTENPGERTFKDNSSTFTIEVSVAKLRVLIAEGSHVKRQVTSSGLCWNDMEFMTRAFEIAGDIECTTLTCQNSALNNARNLFKVSFHNGEMLLDSNGTFPSTRDELYSYDVIIISDMPIGNFSQDQLQWVVDWVLERGGGFLMAGGWASFDRGAYDQSPWERIIPVDLKNYGNGQIGKTFRMTVPKKARDHPIWKLSSDPLENDTILDSHPEWLGTNLVRRVKAGALILANRPESPDYPVIAAQSYGRGRSIAFLPDPNGKWGTKAITWAPSEQEWSAPPIDLGQPTLKFNQAASVPPVGVLIKEHPSPYYGRFWVNVVRWLGENSIRWKRDQLAGRVLAATATPGKPLTVAAEVLAVTDPAALDALDVGARLDLPGSPRIPLEYNRDQREFIGRIPIPDDLANSSARILFDSNGGGKTQTDVITATVLNTSREFVETKPDAAVMHEIATAGGSEPFATSGQAAQAISVLARRSATRATEFWHRPLWPRWELWAALAALLCLEWLLRQRGNTVRAV